MRHFRVGRRSAQQQQTAQTGGTQSGGPQTTGSTPPVSGPNGPGPQPIRLDVGYRVPGVQFPGGATFERPPGTLLGLPIAFAFGIGEAF